jgi:hypothetical protein
VIDDSAIAISYWLNRIANSAPLLKARESVASAAEAHLAARQLVVGNLA